MPQVVLGSRGGRHWVTAVDGAEPPPLRSSPPTPAPTERIRYAGSTMSELRWLEIVAQVIDAIEKGKLDKVVLARDLLVWSKTGFDMRLLAGRLATLYPQCFTFVFDGLIGATPELLVRRRGLDVESLVLAGSAARGRDEAADETLGFDLLHSVKDLDEHRPALESVRSVLSEVCSELRSDAEPFLLKLPNVQHLATKLRGRLASPLSALELAGSLHPTAAICGTPTSIALDLIQVARGDGARPLQRAGGLDLGLGRRRMGDRPEMRRAQWGPWAPLRRLGHRQGLPCRRRSSRRRVSSSGRCRPRWRASPL